MNRVVVLCALCLTLTGCAFTPQGITLAPKVDVAPSEIGKNKELPLNVVDERAKKTLGTVGARNIGADITINGDIVVSVQKALSEGLSRMNFKPTTERNGAKNELRVEIRNLDYTVIVGFWAGTLRVDAALKGICLRDGLRPYEKLHHGEFIESVQVVQSQEANTEYINKALSTAVNALLSDKELIACLAGQGK